MILNVNISCVNFTYIVVQQVSRTLPPMILIVRTDHGISKLIRRRILKVRCDLLKENSKSYISSASLGFQLIPVEVR